MTSAPPPVVLVHGVGLDHHLWSSMRDHLSPGRPVIAYDTLGHGDGPHPDGPYRLTDYVEQLDRVVALHSPGAPVDLVGFSMGALIAQGYAAAHPERVHRLVLLATVFARSNDERASVVQRVAEVRSGGYRRSVDVAIERWFAPEFAAAHPDVVAAVRARMETNDVTAYANAYEVFATGDAELVASVDRIVAPTLVVAGELDPRSTPAMAHALAARLRHGRAVVLPGLRHCLMLEAPEAVAALIDVFLDEDRSEP